MIYKGITLGLLIMILITLFDITAMLKENSTKIDNVSNNVSIVVKDISDMKKPFWERIGVSK